MSARIRPVIQPGLPSGVPFAGSLALTPVNGAEIACVISNGVQSYAVSQTASAASARPGDTITYTVVVTNTGSYSYPAGGASFALDLTGQLDDAVVAPASVTVTAGAATLGASLLSWSGPLPATGAGSSVTVTYQVTVRPADTGDHHLAGALTATGAGGSCSSGCGLSVPVQSYRASLAADATVVTPGATVGYTITVTNTGQVAYAGGAATVRVDLSGVSDDAAYVAQSAAASAGTIQLSKTALAWGGPLPIGASVTVHFQMRALVGGHGDASLVSTLGVLGPAGGCVNGCAVTVALAEFTVSILSDTTAVVPGQAVTYTAQVKNIGRAPFAAASFTDDLADLLDDATLIPNSVTASAGTAQLAAAALTWTGPLAVTPAAGSTVTVTFSVRLNDPLTGDHTLNNDLTATGPGAVHRPSSGGGPAAAIQAFTVAPAITATGIGAGNVAVLSLTTTNTGPAPTPPRTRRASPSRCRAPWPAQPVDTAGPAGATSGLDLLSWTGPLAAGATVEITFTLVLGRVTVTRGCWPRSPPRPAAVAAASGSRLRSPAPRRRPWSPGRWPPR